MLRRLVLLVASSLLISIGSAWAGTTPLPIRLLDSVDLALTDQGGAAEMLEMADSLGDIYHPAGTPGYTGGNIDIRGVRLGVWATDLQQRGHSAPKSPFDSSLNSDGIRRSSPEGLDFDTGGPYVIAQIQLDLDVDYSADLFCEYPLAWQVPEHEAFSGIPGDLFNGTNYVTVIRTGQGVPDGFSAAGLEFMGGTWEERAAHGFAAAIGEELFYAIPASEFGAAGDAMIAGFPSFLRGRQASDGNVDFNFGAFCSEGGQSFDPTLGGVDILQAPVSLTDLPVFVVGPLAPPPPPTTTVPPTTSPPTTSPPTTVATAPPTSVVAAPLTDDGGANPLLIALLVGGAGAAAFGIWKWLQDRAEKAKRGGGFRFRVELERGMSASFSEVSGLETEPAPIDYRTGAEPETTMRAPTIQKFTNLVLKRGMTDSPEFYNWIRSASQDDAVGGSLFMESLEGPAVEWTFQKGWPKKWVGPTFNPNLNETAIESMELTVEGLEMRLRP